MKNKKLITVLIALIALTSILVACDGVTVEDVRSSDQVSINALNDSFTADNSGGPSASMENSNLNNGNSDSSSDDSFNVSLSGSSESDSMSDASMTDSRSNDLKVMGAVTAVTANTITIGGVTYTVDTTEDLTTLFAVGDLIEAEYFINDDGTITLKEFNFEDTSGSSSSNDMYTEVKTLVTEGAANTITINGQTFTVDALDDLTTLMTAGQTYEIEYVLNADGTITILSFHSEDDMSDDSSDDMSDDSSDDMNDDSNDDMNNNNDNNSNNNSNNNDDSNDFFDNDNNDDYSSGSGSTNP